MAGALVGGAFLSASLQVLFDRMASREVIDFFNGKKRDTQLLKKLEVTLLSVDAVLDDAEEKQIVNKNVKKWLNELKNAVYEAEDLLDEITTESLRCKLEAESQTSTTQVRKFFSFLNPFNNGIESKLEEIIERIEFLAKQKELLPLKEGIGEKPSRNKLPAASLVDESGVIGRDDDKESIMKLLLSDDPMGSSVGVITVVGMGGIGKTTLAQFVYNDDRVKQWFDLKIWVCVSEEFDVSQVTKTILQAITSVTREVGDLNLLQVELTQCLMGKKFLLVLDDVWNESYVHWEVLKNPLAYGAQGSKIIVTTRSENVASIMRTFPSYCLSQLTDEQCWLLFAKHAFGNSNSGRHPKLDLIGREIMKKCHGLPLAAKSLGGLLRSKKDIAEWENVLNSDIWDLSNGENTILPALRLSYHHLPSHLKRCFAYCSVFPKDFVFEIDHLVRLWMAEGFLQQHNRNKTMEELGVEYFNDLLSRSFFHQSRGNEKHYLMHDLINDLAKVVSGDFCFRLEDGRFCDIPKVVRHFSYFRTVYDELEKFKALNEAKFVRTFLPFKRSFWFMMLSTEVYQDQLPTLRCLRVLCLSTYDNILELPSLIGELKLLRYLDLSCTPIKRLPESICSLCNLETLILADCGSLTELPTQLGRLINLRHLDISGVFLLKEMPLHMSKLKNLQILSTFILGSSGGSSIGELGELQQIRGALSILNLQNVANATDAFQAKLKDKEYLSELNLKWGGHTDDTSTERYVLDMLQPNVNLKKLTIENYGGTRFSDWLGDYSFSNIVSLQLSHSKYCFSLPSLGHLPSLRELFIIGFDAVETVGSDFYGRSFSAIRPFRCLEILWFEKMLQWQEWLSSENGNGGGFPNLKELHIRKCPKLTGVLPNCLPSLRKLMIIDCQQLMSSLPWVPVINELHLGYSDKVLLREVPPGLCRFTVRGCNSLESLPEGIISNINLEELKISDCPLLLSFPQDGLPVALKRLEIRNCKRLQLPMQTCYSSLQTLFISLSCESLRSFQLQLFPNLNHLTLRGCRNLESLSVSKGPNQILMSLRSLEIILCPNFASFPDGGLPAPNLTKLKISDCVSLKSLPEKMHSLLPSVKSLNIYNCPELDSFPGGGLPPNLNSLVISFSDKLIASRSDWGLQKLSSVRYFSIRGKCEGTESFPEECLLPSTLMFLWIDDIPNLKSLNNRGLRHLTSLTKLEIARCPELQSMSGPELPDSLSVLRIEDCPLLKQRCQKEKGEDWPKIAHIPYIEIDDEIVC